MINKEISATIGQQIAKIITYKNIFKMLVFYQILIRLTNWFLSNIGNIFWFSFTIYLRN